MAKTSNKYYGFKRSHIKTKKKHGSRSKKGFKYDLGRLTYFLFIYLIKNI